MFELVIPNIQAEELFERERTITPSNAKELAILAGSSVEDADNFESQLLRRELKNVHPQ